jgi:transcription elongation factor Elf1
MPQVQSFICPHCNEAVGATQMPDYMAVSAPVPRGLAVYVLVCPHCNAAIGAYSTPTHTGLLPPN